MSRSLLGRLFLSFISLYFFLFLLYGFFHSILGLSVLAAVLLSLALAATVAYFLARSLTSPIRRLTEKTLKLLPEELHKEILTLSRDEMERLAYAIERLGVQLRKRIEEVSSERNYLDAILQGMVEGVLVVDAGGRILTGNDALRRMLSLSSGVVGKTALEVIRNVELEEAIQRVLREGKPISLEFQTSSPDRKTFFVNLVGIGRSSESPEEPGEKNSGVIAVFHDITHLKGLEKIRQDFVANVSHELRTPLTTIKGYAETLLEGALHEKVAFEFVQVIKRQADRLAKIVEDLLALSKIESREFALKIETIFLNELIQDVITLFREQAEKRRISILHRQEDPDLSVQGDRGYLEQALSNLLDNALKYGREGGMVEIVAKALNSQEVQISVEDDGIGIPGDELSRVFERFYRVDKARSQELGGTGLGLSIVKHIVQAHGGRVWAESQFEKGSTFYVNLPKELASLSSRD